MPQRKVGRTKIKAYFLQGIASIENNWRQNDIEEYLGIKCCLQIDFILFGIDYLPPKRIGVCLIWYVAAGIQFAGKLYAKEKKKKRKREDGNKIPWVNIDIIHDNYYGYSM